MKKLWLWLFSSWVSEVRQEARRRTLDEFVALNSRQTIERGVGSDVEAVYWFIHFGGRRAK